MITAVVLTKNEEKNIKECLETVKWCDEIVVIDDYSEDKTVEIVEKLGVKVFRHHLGNDFARQRNFALRQAQGEWVLFIDADERVSAALAAEITNYKLHITNYSGFYFRRNDWFLGRWLNHGETANVKLLRLAKKGTGRWKRRVHETWEIEGRIGELKNPLLHYPHQTISQFLEQINRYTTIDAYQFYKKGKKFSLWQILVYPPAKFIQNYLLKFGFLDGFPGLVMALMMSLHSLITRVKLWEVLFPAKSSASIKILFSPSKRVRG